MKIIQICAAYKPAYIYGGPTMSVSKLSEELVKAGQDVTVLATTANGKKELDVPTGKEQFVDGVKVFYFKRLTKDHTHFSPALFWFLYKLIFKEKKAGRTKDLVLHVHAWWNLISIFSCLMAKLYGVKVVLSPRGMLNNYTLSNKNSVTKRIIHFFIGKSLLKYCDVHATSINEKNDIYDFSRNESQIIPNFVNIPKFNTVKPTENATYKLIFLARINKIKGLENLFLALAKLNMLWLLDIAGDGEPLYIETLKKLAATYQINDKITWRGHVQGEYKFDLLARADLLILPSIKENFANVVIEALSIGTPVLVSDGVGVKDYITQTGLGWISTTNPKDLAEKINQSFLEKEKRTYICKNAPQIIRKDFDKTILVNEYITMYNNLIIKNDRI